MPKLALTTLLVEDYDAAISFFVEGLGFELRENTWISNEKRWVVVAPRGSENSLLLARAVNARQTAAVGNQAGGRVFLFLETDDFARDHAAFTAKGIRFTAPPRSEPYGTVAVFEDLCGNRWDLIGPAAPV